VRRITAQYFRQLRLVLKDRPHLRPCLKRCRHCRILFFTHPRNSGRIDIDCPFGCRQAHRKQSAATRSIEYYRSCEGKEKKKLLNARRKSREKTQVTPGDDHIMTGHLQVVTSLVEGRFVAFSDIDIMVNNILRQLSIDKEANKLYRGLSP